MPQPSCKVTLISWETECSVFTPGAIWKQNYYAIEGTALVPVAIAKRLEKSEDEIYLWLEYLSNLAI